MTQPKILVLAGRRSATLDPLAEAAGVSHKCLVPVAGVPMVVRVLETAAEAYPEAPLFVSIEDFSIIEDQPIVARLQAEGRLTAIEARHHIVDSIVHASELQVFGTELPPGSESAPSTGAGTGSGTGSVTGSGTGTGTGTGTTSGAAATRIRMIVKRAYQTRQKPAPVLFLTIRSAVEKEAGKFLVRINKKSYKVVATADGTARIKVRKSRLRPGRNTVRVRFVPSDATAFAPSRTKLRRITVERRR